MIELRAPAALGDLAARFGGHVDAGARDLVVRFLAPLDASAAATLSPFTSRRFADAARRAPGALLVSTDVAGLAHEGRRWVHDDAASVLVSLLEELEPSPRDTRSRANIDSNATVDRYADIGPGVVILAGAVVAHDTRIEPNAVIYGGSVIGTRVVIGAGAIIGRPGFGILPGDPLHRRIPQLGGVIIEDDVEIGPLVTVDAGTLGPTVIERGAKLDAHVHVGHNTRIRAGAIVAAQAGFAGSVDVGARALIGGQAGVADHVKIGDGARLAAKSGVIGDVSPGKTVAGYPAVERWRWLRAMATLLRRG